MAYTDKDALKVDLDIAADNTDDDDLLTTYIAQAQAWIDRYCGQTFEAASDSTRYFVATSVYEGGAVDGRDLVLDAPLCAITSVTNGDGTVVAASSYLTQPLNATPYYALRLKVSASLTWTHDTDVETDLIAVVGKWAFSTTAPADIVRACTRLAKWYYQGRNTGLDLDRAVNTGNAIYAPTSVPSDIYRSLEPYVRRVPKWPIPIWPR